MEKGAFYPMIGLMSGTSGDGLDIVFAHFSDADPKSWNFDLIKGETVPFPQTLAEELAQSHLLSAEKLALLDIAFGKWMGEQVAEFCQRNRFSPLAVASHGHTVYHQPHLGLTLQIGNGWPLHLSSGLPVVNDFRSLDVQLGGQGAPLVPIGDRLLFGEYDYCLNLGGIANISMESKGKRIAFDICPFNLLFNHFAKKVGKDYDEYGDLASQGNPISSLLQKLEHLPYYRIDGAKSLGREDIERDFLPLLEGETLPIPDTMATLSEHFALRIQKVLDDQFKQRNTMLCTGGGSYNRHFIDRLRSKLKHNTEVLVPNESLVNFKEALVFAFLGLLRILGKTNSLSSVTGARKDSCGGTMYGFSNENNLN